MKLLNFSHLGSKSAKISFNYHHRPDDIHIAKVQLHRIMFLSFLISVVFALLRSITF